MTVIIIVRGLTASIVNYFPSLLYTPISTAFGTGLTQVSLITSISAITLVIMNPIGALTLMLLVIDVLPVLMLAAVLVGVVISGGMALVCKSNQQI